jgi:hypothetical protein
MPATRNKGDSQPPPPPPPSTPNHGAWTQNNGQWVWTPNATPDQGLVKQYGYGSLTDIRSDPSGTLNHGAWTPQHGGGWTWTWGANPDPNLAKTWGDGALSNPNQTPQGGGGVATPPPPDVTPPDISDTWGGDAPSVTGTLPPPPDGTPQTVTQPPSHSPYVVSPGGIRNAENVLLGQIDTAISQYDDLKASVEQSATENLYPDGATRAQLLAIEHNLLLNIGDALQLAGQYVSMLNYSAQNYAHADIGSFLPQS